MTNTGGTKVTYDDLVSLSTQLTNQMSNLQQVINNASKYVNEVAGVSWQSSAAQNFTNLHTQWQSSAKQIMDAGNGMASFLKQAANAYQETDQSLAKGIQS